MSEWYIVRTATRRERSALAALSEQGLAVFLPMETRWRQTSSARELVYQPLFPGYLFVLAGEDDYRRILETDGVHQFVSYTANDGTAQPITLPVSVVIGIQAEERAGLYDRTVTRKAIPYRPRKGDRVKIAAGPYFGFIAKVLAAPRGERCKLLVEGFDKPRKRTEDVGHLSAA